MYTTITYYEIYNCGLCSSHSGKGQTSLENRDGWKWKFADDDFTGKVMHEILFSNWVPRLHRMEPKEQRDDHSKGCLSLLTYNKEDFF